MVAVVKADVESGKYSSASEAIRQTLWGWKLRRKVEELRRLVREGIDNCPSVDAELLFSRLRAKYQVMPIRQDF
jgi:antitoxin ParD1/3/4